ncbi:MAG: putative RNA uridine N3 methyltransferase [Candidatus Bathyarchaeia archaeon]|jgi:predicted SPOUT superfamily RNA methylase MTH1
MAKHRLAVAIPASFIADTPHLREKTSKIGFIGRAAAIFRVDEIIVYVDDLKANQSRDLDLIALLLRYMETPQYLRKRLFGLQPELQYAGILPPLRTPHHPLQSKLRDLRMGEFREGVAVSKSKAGTLVDIGVEKLVLLPNVQAALDKRLTVQVIKTVAPVEVQVADREAAPDYWGYTVSVVKGGLVELLKRRKFDLTLGTSKFATRLQDAAARLHVSWKKAQSILVLFGAPSKGLHEIARDEGVNLNDLVNYVLNTVPGQGTETVRTEEAFLATLAVLNVQFVESA